MAESFQPCPSCGARPKRATEERVCAFCGTERPAAPLPENGAPPHAAPVPAASAHASAAVRFERLRAHASLGELLVKRPSSAGPLASNAAGLLFAVIFLGIAVFVTSGFWLVGNVASEGLESVTPGSHVGRGAVFVFKLVPIAFVGIGCFLVYRMLARGARFAASDLATKLALVVDERVRVSGGGDAGTNTTYFVSIENESGQRTEYETSDTVAGKVAQGDMGVAYVRADRLLDFERVAV